MGNLRRVKRHFFTKLDWKKKVTRWGQMKIIVQVTQTKKSIKRKYEKAKRALRIIDQVTRPKKRKAKP